MSYKEHPNYAGLRDVDLEEVQLRADALKSNFYKLENLKRAFAFLTKVAGKGAVNRDVFVLLLQKADKLDVWRYAGLPVWAVPYILLTLADFYIQRESKPTYVVRFVIDKPSRSKLNTTWLQPEQCSLVKYFVNRGRATNVFGGKSSVAGQSSGANRVKNPLPFSEAEFNLLTADISWISSGLDNLLAEISVESVVEVDDDIPGHQAPSSGSAAVPNPADFARVGTARARAVSSNASVFGANATQASPTVSARANATNAQPQFQTRQIVDFDGESKGSVDGPASRRVLPGVASLGLSTPVRSGELGSYRPPREASDTSTGSSPTQQFLPAAAAPAELDIRVGESPPSSIASGPNCSFPSSEGVKGAAMPSRNASEIANVKVSSPIQVNAAAPRARQAGAKSILRWLMSLFS